MKRPTMRAGRALVHPLWVLSLLLMVINDHYLKSAGLVPGWLTGKLSDLAGYFLFPLLLATALRVRTRRGAALAHAVAVVLLLVLELSPAACAMVERVFGVRMWADPTDLVALASIAASWLVLVPAAERAEPLRLVLSRSLAAAGGLACVATSPPPPAPPRAQFASAYLWNRTGSDIQVRVSAPRQDVVVRCEDVEAFGPEAILQESHFRVVRHVVVVADGRISLDGFERGRCTVLLIAAEGVAPRLVAWNKDALSSVDFANDPTLVSVRIEQDALARSLVAPMPYHVAAATRLAPPSEGACVPPPPFSDAAWSEPLPAEGKPLTLRAAHRGPDGCDALEVAAEGDPSKTFIVCIDPLPLPFVAGDTLTFRRPQGDQGVVIASDAATIVAVTGTGATIAGKGECMPAAHDCVVGTQRRVTVMTPAGALMLAPGDLRTITGGGYQVTAHAARAEMVHVADQQCDANVTTGFHASYAWVARKEKP